MRLFSREEWSFTVVVIALAGCWLLLQMRGFPVAEKESRDCRILDIAIETPKEEEGNGKICRVVIEVNEQVRYRVHRPEGGESVLVELPCMRMAEGVGETALSNDLVRQIWVRACESGRLTVGLDLDSRRMRVSDRLRVGENWEIVIELERRSTRDIPLPAQVPEGQSVV